MANDYTVTEDGSGTLFSAKDDGSRKWPRVILAGEAGSPAGIAVGQGAMAASLPVVVASDQTQLTVGGATVLPSATFTRPNDTTAYATGDTMQAVTSSPSAFSIAAVSRINNGSGMIVSAVLTSSANQATKGDFEVWLYDTTYTPQNDNAAFAPTDGETLTLIGILQFGNNPIIGNSAAGASGNVVYRLNGLAMPFVCLGGAKLLYWSMAARNAYTPVANEIFTIRLGVIQD